MRNNIPELEKKIKQILDGVLPVGAFSLRKDAEEKLQGVLVFTSAGHKKNSGGISIYEQVVNPDSQPGKPWTNYKFMNDRTYASIPEALSQYRVGGMPLKDCVSDVQFFNIIG
ncbi:MAG TPA: hypothetical protein DD637_03150 [Verrucomicrobia bacterium]|nr:hypothetical protein [Verrucomicrobiota bacterium]HCG20547.1 hypothetical protein [Verrucomicrobiota bacterium]